MVKEDTDINEYPEPKGNSQYNEFVGIIFKNNLAMVKSCNMLFDENKRLQEIIDQLVDTRDSVVKRCEQLEKEADWLATEITKKTFQDQDDGILPYISLEGGKKYWRNFAKEQAENKSEANC